jgi:hypothetical protein
MFTVLGVVRWYFHGENKVNARMEPLINNILGGELNRHAYEFRR